MTHPNSVSSVVYAFPGCIPILPTNLILNPILVSFSVSPSLRVPFSFLTLPSKKSMSRHVKFVENVFSFMSLSTSTTSVINTTSALPASSFTSCDYPTPHNNTPHTADLVKPLTRHPVSSEGVIFLFFITTLITFKLVHSYNVKHLTYTIFCSSGLQNIYKLNIWKCSTFTILTLLHLFTNNKKDITNTK